jgi:PAS domain S-box-containing protein
MSNGKDTSPQSQQSQKDRAFQLLMENVTDYAIFFLDAERRVTEWNKGAERILGYQEQEVIGRPADLIFTPEDRQREASEMEMQAALQAGRAEDDRWHLRKDGSRFFASGILTCLRDEEGRLQGFAKILRDRTAQRQAEEALRRSHKELTEAAHQLVAKEQIQGFLKRLVFAQEDERKRISRDLHDTLGQQVTALNLKIEVLKAKCGDQEELCQEIEQVQKVVTELDSQLDFLVWELQPAGLEQLGLAPAVDNYVREWSENFQIKAEFHCSGKDGQRFLPEVETNLYRILQEALNNTAKHADAKEVGVLLDRRNGDIRLVIEDDGVGFDPQAVAVREDGKGIGLISIKERAALLGGNAEIESSPGAGTTIIVRVPFAMPDGSP